MSGEIEYGGVKVSSKGMLGKTRSGSYLCWVHWEEALGRFLSFTKITKT